MAARGRPAGKTAASARKATAKAQPARLIEKDGKTCISCRPQDAFRPLSSFYASSSPLHADGLVPICKDCIVKLSFDFVSNRINMTGFMAVLRQIDRPFIKSVLDKAYKEFDDAYGLDKVREKVRMENCHQVISGYFKILLSSPTYRRYRWEDGDSPVIAQEVKDDVPARSAPTKREVTEEIRRRFGLGFTEDDYLFLQDEYDEWCESQGGEPDDKSQREIIKNLCFAKLTTVRGVLGGGNISQIITSFNNSLTAGNLKPQEKKSDATPLGVVIRDIQNYTPAEFYADKKLHCDVQGIEEYMERFILRPMRNTMLGERNEDKEYTVMTDESE